MSFAARAMVPDSGTQGATPASVREVLGAVVGAGRCAWQVAATRSRQMPDATPTGTTRASGRDLLAGRAGTVLRSLATAITTPTTSSASTRPNRTSPATF